MFNANFTLFKKKKEKVNWKGAPSTIKSMVALFFPYTWGLPPQFVLVTRTLTNFYPLQFTRTYTFFMKKSIIRLLNDFGITISRPACVQQTKTLLSPPKDGPARQRTRGFTSSRIIGTQWMPKLLLLKLQLCQTHKKLHWHKTFPQIISLEVQKFGIDFTSQLDSVVINHFFHICKMWFFLLGLK